MSERPDPRGDLAAYLAGWLDPEESRRFAAELEASPELMAELRELESTVRLLDAREEEFEAPADLAEGVEDAVRAVAGVPHPEQNGNAPSAAPDSAVVPPVRGQSWPRRLALAGGVALALGLAAFAGTRVADDEPVPPLGTLEVSGSLSAPGGGDAGTLEVRALGIGREIAFSSDALPILPKGDYYELWFVGPSDTREDANRISAGTFHPDENGRSDVLFTAAVDPALYPVIEITAEPGDGNPAATGEVVARLDSR